MCRGRLAGRTSHAATHPERSDLVSAASRPGPRAVGQSEAHARSPGKQISTLLPRRPAAATPLLLLQFLASAKQHCSAGLEQPGCMPGRSWMRQSRERLSFKLTADHLQREGQDALCEHARDAMGRRGRDTGGNACGGRVDPFGVDAVVDLSDADQGPILDDCDVLVERTVRFAERYAPACDDGSQLMERALTERRETEVERRDSAMLEDRDVSELGPGDIEVMSQDEEPGVRALVLRRAYRALIAGLYDQGALGTIRVRFRSPPDRWWVRRSDPVVVTEGRFPRL